MLHFNQRTNEIKLLLT